MKRLMSSCLILTALILTPCQVLAQTESVSVSSPDSLDHGNSGVISVIVTGDNIGAFELHLTCDNSDIRFDKVSVGKGPNGFSILANVNSSSSAAVSGFMSATAITENVTVADISFTAAGKTGRSATIAVNGTLYDPDGNEIEGVIFSDATVQITGKGDPNSLLILLMSIGALFLVLVSLLIIRALKSRHKKDIDLSETIVLITE